MDSFIKAYIKYNIFAFVSSKFRENLNKIIKKKNSLLSLFKKLRF
jgi:hypothetical protein